MKKLTVEQIFEKNKKKALKQIKNAKSFIILVDKNTGNSYALDFNLYK